MYRWSVKLFFSYTTLKNRLFFVENNSWTVVFIKWTILLHEISSQIISWHLFFGIFSWKDNEIIATGVKWIKMHSFYNYCRQMYTKTSITWSPIFFTKKKRFLRAYKKKFCTFHRKYSGKNFTDSQQWKDALFSKKKTWWPEKKLVCV